MAVKNLFRGSLAQMPTDSNSIAAPA